MKLGEYLEDKIVVILLNIACMMGLSLYLLATGNYYTNVLLILIAWIVILIAYFFIDFACRKKYYCKMKNILNELDKKYLIGDIYCDTPRLNDRIYHEVLRKSNKSVIEEIRKVKDSSQEYKEYIEGWIHDVKSPLTAIMLMCENSDEQDINTTMRKIKYEASLINSQVENVLFYARSEEAYKDYVIHRVDICEVVKDTLKKNKSYFIERKIKVIVNIKDGVVSTDEKWVEFLLTQIFSNSIKYSTSNNPYVKISSKRNNKNLLLVIEDNGCGIPRNDILRIFDKGFTGTNGRKYKNNSGSTSTGIGLYLCKKLCDKLGIGIKCESDSTTYTRMILIFPDNESLVNLSKL